MAIFYTQVDGAVSKALDARKGIYGSKERGGGNRAEQAHTWLFKKMAYVNASAKNQDGKVANLATPTKGGLGKMNGSGKSSGGLYTGAGGRNKHGDSNAVRFIPKPHINSVRIGSDGDFGSIKKCEVAFSVYSLADLDLMAPFFAIGGELGVSYGWNEGGGAAGKPGAFQGKIYNFSYTVNTNGGFDCISYGMGKGINVLSINADAPKDAKGEKVTDPELGDVVKHSNDVINKITNDCTALPDLVDAYDVEKGIGAVKYETDWGNPPDRTEDSEAEKGEPQTQYYVSLEHVIVLFNEMVLESGGPAFKTVKLICDSTVTKGNLPGIEPFASANPTEVMFPGKATYNAERTFTFGDIDTAFASAEVDLSKCMFNVEWLKKEFEKLGKTTVKGQKSSDSTISALLKALFDCVMVNSGNHFKLTTTSDPTDPTGNRLLIVDGNYIDKTIIPYEITAVTESGICRNISLTSKVPSEMATAAMVSANSAATNHNPAAFALLNAGGDKKPEKVPANKTEAELTEALKDSMNAIATSGVSAENIKSAQTAIKASIAGAPPDGKTGITMPIDFSCTLDGIEGFVFGNTIVCNYLPSLYKRAPLTCFTVTKVEHNISGNDWTTTLSTVFRLIPV